MIYGKMVKSQQPSKYGQAGSVLAKCIGNPPVLKGVKGGMKLPRS
jgi:hypothetical protein